VSRLVKRIDLGVTDVVIHWRFSQNECELTRSEVSPEARKKGDGGRVVEIGANRQSGDPSSPLLFKLVLEVVAGVSGCSRRRENPLEECSNPCKDSGRAGMLRKDSLRS